MRKRKTTIAVVTAILLTTGALWAYMRSGPDPQVEKVKQLQAEMAKAGTWPEPAKMAELQKAEEQLTPAQRRDVRENGREQREQAMDRAIDTYFSLPPDKRAAYLDEKIKEGEKRRQAWEANRGQRGGSGGGNGGPGGGGALAGRQGGPGGPGGGAGGPGGQGGAGGPNTDQRAQRQLQRMDSMPATRRAQFQTFMADMNQRRVDQGLPPMTRRPLPPR